MTRRRFFAGRHRRIRTAFTLVEAVVAVAITAIAASALLLGVSSALQTTNHGLEQAIATGMAQQLLDEVLGARYAAVGMGGYQTSLGPSGYERNGLGRERYNDIDDYHGLRNKPPEDPWRVELGTEDTLGRTRHPNFQAPPGFFDHWREKVNVYYVSQADQTTRLPQGQVSDYREVVVRIYRVDPNRGQRLLVKLKRVVAYVPPLE